VFEKLVVVSSVDPIWVSKGSESNGLRGFSRRKDGRRTVPRRTEGERRDLRQRIKLQRQIKSMSKILQNQIPVLKAWVMIEEQDPAIYLTHKSRCLKLG
jgi:hypothetical protein